MPFTRARAENSIKMTAMIGMGLMATPTAQVRTSLIPCPMWPLLSQVSRQIWWTGCGSPWPVVRVSRQESTSSSNAISSLEGAGTPSAARSRRRHRSARLRTRGIGDDEDRAHAGERVLVVGAGERVQGVAPVTPQIALLRSRGR